MATVPVVSRGIGRKPPSEIRIENGVAIVTLTRGLETIVDVSDVEIVAGYRWVAFIHHQTGHAYAVRNVGRKCILMHRQLLEPGPEMTVDHADGDGLNNRRSNIRIATPNQNGANQVLNRRNKLGIKGVHQVGNKYHAAIKPNGKSISLGSYGTKEEAAAAYFGAAKVLWGEFARQ